MSRRTPEEARRIAESLGPAEKLVQLIINFPDHLWHNRPGVMRNGKWKAATRKEIEEHKTSGRVRGGCLRAATAVQILHAVPFGGTAPAAHVVQRRDGALKTRKVPVQIRPWAPFVAGASRPCSPMQRHEAQTFASAGASPATGTTLECQPDQRTGHSVLTSACLRASGASPRHSAIFGRPRA